MSYTSDISDEEEDIIGIYEEEATPLEPPTPITPFTPFPNHSNKNHFANSNNIKPSNNIFLNTQTTNAKGISSTTTTAVNLTRKDDLVKFSTMCKLFEKIQNEKTASKRIRYIISFWDYLGKQTDLYPFMRLILPDQDSERGRYGLKDKKLAELYIDSIPLPKNSDDAKRLRSWKDPTTGSTATCFADALYTLLKKKGWNETIERNPYQKTKFTGSNNKELVSVREINELLDELAKGGESNSEEKRRIIMIFLKRLTTATEHKWLAKIILKDMRMHLKHETILNAFHEKAVELYNRCTDLREVLTIIQSNSSELTNMGLRPFSAFKPMLAALAFMEKLSALLRNEDIVSETKFDGERVMIHKHKNQIKYFTRNSQDYTNIYASKFDRMVRKCVTATTCILDGEMLVWSNELGCFREFGHNRTFGLSEENNGSEQFCYVAFDMVVLEDKDISSLPLSERRRHLETVVTHEDHHFEIVKQKRMTTHHDVMQELQTSIQNRDEGIILKNWNSPYVPAERKQNWIKLKPDHVDGMGETLDLIIVGGYYGTKFNRKSVSHFLLAVAEPVSSSSRALVSSLDNISQVSQSSSSSSQYPTKFYTFCKVGSGYNNAELTVLQEQLKPHFVPYEKGKCPAYLKNFKPKSGETPDVWLDDPKNSKIIEVKAYEFVKESEMYSCTYTLRFPRVKRIRDDKSWHECLDIKQLQNMVVASQQKYANQNFANSGATLVSSKSAKNKQRTGQTDSGEGRKRRGATTLSEFLGVDAASVEVKSNLFKDKEFVVLNCQHPYKKSDIEKLIIAHSGSCVQNPTEKTNYILACKEKNMRVQNWIKCCREGKSQFGDKDIIQCKWLVACVEKNMVVSLEPSIMIYTSKATEAFFKTKMDKYLDDYTSDATLESIKTSFELVNKFHARDSRMINSKTIIDINSNYRDQLNFSLSEMFMRPVCAIFCPFTEEDSVMWDSLLIRMQMCGAKLITMDETKDDFNVPVTHIICGSMPALKHVPLMEKYLSKFTPFITKNNLQFVTADWVRLCLKEVSLVDPTPGVNCWVDNVKSTLVAKVVCPPPPKVHLDLPKEKALTQPSPKTLPNTDNYKRQRKKKDVATPPKIKRKRQVADGSPSPNNRKKLKLKSPELRLKTSKKSKQVSPAKQGKRTQQRKEQQPEESTPPPRRKPAPITRIDTPSPIDLCTPSPRPRPRKVTLIASLSQSQQQHNQSQAQAPQSPVLFSSPLTSPVTPVRRKARVTRVMTPDMASPELI